MFNPQNDICAAFSSVLRLSMAIAVECQEVGVKDQAGKGGVTATVRQNRRDEIPERETTYSHR